jgi:hypothetical protein
MSNAIHNEIAGRVRCSADNKSWSIEDLIEYFRPDLSPHEVIETINRMVCALGDIFHEHPQMAMWGEESQGWSSCLAVNAENLLSVLSLLLRDIATDIGIWKGETPEAAKNGERSAGRKEPVRTIMVKDNENNAEALAVSVDDVPHAAILDRRPPISRSQFDSSSMLLSENCSLGQVIENNSDNKVKKENNMNRTLKVQERYLRLGKEAVKNHDYEGAATNYALCLSTITPKEAKELAGDFLCNVPFEGALLLWGEFYKYELDNYANPSVRAYFECLNRYVMENAPPDIKARLDSIFSGQE